VCTPCRPTECFRRRQSRYQLAVSTRSQLRIKALPRKKLFKLQRRDRPQEAKSIPVTAVVPYSTAYTYVDGGNCRRKTTARRLYRLTLYDAFTANELRGVIRVTWGLGPTLVI